MLIVQEIAGKGRGLVATRDIAAGEVVLSERPLMMYPHCDALGSVCSHCLRSLHLPGKGRSKPSADRASDDCLLAVDSVR
jgi:hypothetical protein